MKPWVVACMLLAMSAPVWAATGTCEDPYVLVPGQPCEVSASDAFVVVPYCEPGRYVLVTSVKVALDVFRDPCDTGEPLARFEKPALRHTMYVAASGMAWIHLRTDAGLILTFEKLPR